MRGGFLSPPPFEDFWVSFLLGWTIEAMLHRVVLLGVFVCEEKFQTESKATEK
jgi:hypothetical protein